MIHGQETIIWTGPGQPRADSSPGPLPEIPGYEILAELGRGGMGVVYKARQLDADRLVALKLIRDSALAGEQDRARFRIEAEASARMQHPNIVRIYGVGEHGGLPYFAMELIEGQSLDKHLAGRRVSAREAAELVRVLALAIEHAHEQKIVHRDLKPANVLMQTTERREQRAEDAAGVPSAFCSLLWDLCPKLTDFGLAKRLDGESTAWTQAGAVLGTAAYMAPEQAAGQVGAIGPATDIYSLGAILYELLTGRPPFLSDSWNQTVWEVLHDEVLPPTRREASVPRDLEAICLTCLEKDALRRYATAGALARDLALFLEERPVAAAPRGDRDRLFRLAARDGYKLLCEIGRGPRSTVYRALYEPLAQTVALKVFAPGICSRETWESRLKEGSTLWGALAHPQIGVVHRAGWWDDAGYVAMDFVPQGSLAARLSESQTYRTSQALHLVEQLTELVNYLHRQGVVHGNLKPSNVLLAADGIPRVTDFRLTGGLFQRALTDDEAEPAGISSVAPEYLEDPTAEPRPFTDIYGLGLILYELLASRPPFGGETVAAAIGQVRTGEPVPPSQFNPEVTPQLDAVCLRCLRKNPWRRYYRVYDLLIRLRYLREDPTGAAEPGQWWLRRRPPDRGER
jgi:serine/threonine protein kinase